MTRRPHWMAVGLVALGMMTSGCYGPFYLTRKVWKWNGEVSDNKWVVEVVFLVCHIVPAYQIAAAADAIIFNSVEFWTGENPLKDANAKAAPQTKRIVRGDTETILTRVGQELSIAQFAHGQPVSTLRIARQGDTTVAMDEQGRLLFTAQTMADGHVVIADAGGKQVASYTSEQASTFLASMPR